MAAIIKIESSQRLVWFFRFLGLGMWYTKEKLPARKYNITVQLVRFFSSIALPLSIISAIINCFNLALTTFSPIFKTFKVWLVLLLLVLDHFAVYFPYDFLYSFVNLEFICLIYWVSIFLSWNYLAPIQLADSLDAYLYKILSLPNKDTRIFAIVVFVLTSLLLIPSLTLFLHFLFRNLQLSYDRLFHSLQCKQHTPFNEEKINKLEFNESSINYINQNKTPLKNIDNNIVLKEKEFTHQSYYNNCPENYFLERKGYKKRLENLKFNTIVLPFYNAKAPSDNNV